MNTFFYLVKKFQNYGRILVEIDIMGGFKKFLFKINNFKNLVFEPKNILFLLFSLDGRKGKRGKVWVA